MHVITRKRLLAFATTHPDLTEPLDRWYRLAHKANWKNIRDVRLVLPHADAIHVASGNIVTVFNIGGNHCRLVAGIHYDRGKLFVLAVLTHAEYTRGLWKEKL